MTDSKLLSLQAACLEQSAKLSELSDEFEVIGRLRGFSEETMLGLIEEAQQAICGEANDCEKRFSEFF